MLHRLPLFLGALSLSLLLLVPETLPAAEQGRQAAASAGKTLPAGKATTAPGSKTLPVGKATAPAEKALPVGKATTAPEGKALPTGKTAHGTSGSGQSWGFGASSDRDAALWRDGVETESLRKRALGRDRGNAASIEHALRQADRRAKAGSRAKQALRNDGEKSRLGVNIRRDDSVWHAELPSSESRADELRPLERRHVVRAYADIMDSDDASLTIGPELMLRDEDREWGKGNKPEDRDASLGLGMQFSLDF